MLNKNQRFDLVINLPVRVNAAKTLKGRRIVRIEEDLKSENLCSVKKKDAKYSDVVIPMFFVSTTYNALVTIALTGGNELSAGERWANLYGA